MCSQLSTRSMIVRASVASYIALSAVWILIAIGNIFLILRNPEKSLESGALIAFLIALGVVLLWCAWLRGFRIIISQGSVSYRDGFFRTTEVHSCEIADIKSAKIVWKIFGQKIGLPRIIVISKNGEIAMQINPKPFVRQDLRRVLKELQRRTGKPKGVGLDY